MSEAAVEDRSQPEPAGQADADKPAGHAKEGGGGEGLPGKVSKLKETPAEKVHKFQKIQIPNLAA